MACQVEVELKVGRLWLPEVRLERSLADDSYVEPEPRRKSARSMPGFQGEEYPACGG
jgi:hypothetical protein